jgi:hypothetical protein
LVASAGVQAAVAVRHVWKASEDAKGVAGCQMALDVEIVVDGGVSREEAG